MDKVKTKLYHKDIYLPKHIKTKFGIKVLNYSFHALRASITDKYGIVNLPTKLNTNTAKVIEAEVLGNRTVKVVYRIPYTAKDDLVLVFIPSTNRVKTVWLNRKHDKHNTLNKERYCKEDKYGRTKTCNNSGY